MKHETYNNAKQCLISIAKEAKRLNRNDKPMIREIINDQADQMHRPLLLGSQVILIVSPFFGNKLLHLYNSFILL